MDLLDKHLEDSIQPGDMPTLDALSEDRRVWKALALAVQFGGIDGSHHKTWVIDQMVRALAGDKYTALVEEACMGEDGPETYEWDTGIAP